MPQDTQNTTMPSVIPSVRTGGYKVGDEVTMYGGTMRVRSLTPEGNPVFDILPNTGGQLDIPKATKKPATVTQQKKDLTQDGKKHLGRWLGNRLNSLYADPTYTNAKPEVQKYYKNKAYDKWVVPYYKHIGIEPQSREAFVNGTLDQKTIDNLNAEILARKSHKEEMAALKVPSQVLAGVSSLLGIAAKYNPFDLDSTAGRFITGRGQKDMADLVTGQPHMTAVEKFFKTSEDYYDRQAKDLEQRIQDAGGHDLETRVVEVSEQAIFFEASGAGSASQLLRATNPKTASIAVKTAKTLWNGAVTGTLWGASTGSKAQDIPKDAAFFALADLGLTGASAGFMKVLNKVSGRGMTTRTLEEAAVELASGRGVEKPKVEDFVKDTPIVNKKAAKAATAKAINEAAQKVTGGSTNGAFKRMTPKQQKALLSRITMAVQGSEKMSLSSEIEETFVKEEEEKMQQVVPAAKQVQDQVDQIISKAGIDPTKAKLGATLPHHQTTVDSPLQNISGRIAFLRNQLKNEDLLVGELDSLREALKQEQDLYTQVKTQQTIDKASKEGLNSPEDVKRFQEQAAQNKHGKSWDLLSGSEKIKLIPEMTRLQNEARKKVTQ